MGEPLWKHSLTVVAVGFAVAIIVNGLLLLALKLGLVGGPCK